MNLIHVNIEPTNKCQLKCKWCGDRKERKVGFMTLKNFDKIIAMIPKQVEIRLFISGEPLLHPKLHTMIDHACLAGHTVLVHSNAVALGPGVTNELVRVANKYPRMVTFSFSLDERHTNNLASVVSNVAYFIGFNQTWGNPINVILQTIVPHPQKREVPQYLRHLSLFAKTYVRWPHNWDCEENTIAGSCNEIFQSPCGFLEDSIAIYWNGDVPLCCTDLNGDRIIGNIFKDALPNIIQALDCFADLQRMGEPCPICEGCERYENSDNRTTRRR